jgi:N-acetylglucosamine-6-sulfatase
MRAGYRTDGTQEKECCLPGFRFNKSFPIARDVKAFLNTEGGITRSALEQGGFEHLRKTVLVLASVALAVVLSTVAYSCGAPVAAQTRAAKPNFVFIIADDMRYDELKYMRKTRALLGSDGMSFKNYFVSTPVCCPARATIMRGQYAHNTGVWFNEVGPRQNTGWQGYKANGNERDNVATRLHAAGYRTGLFGKYLNGYVNTTFVPRGWDDWFAMQPPFYFNYRVNDNGNIRHYGRGPTDYQTDVLSEETQQFIGASVSKRKPFFAYVAPKAPHNPATPAPRDLHTHDGEKAPRLPSFNEANVSDKPPWISSRPRLSAAQISEANKLHENRAESLRAVDDLVAGVVNELKREGVLGNTYIFFTSDNGLQIGEHRILQGKGRPYEESIHMPLLVRGPGVARGSTTAKLALNTDFLPTFSNLAGIQTPSYVDGRSLRPILKRQRTSTWRSAILIEHRQKGLPRNNNKEMDFSGIRTSKGTKYIEYGGGFRELYKLHSDHYELTNRYDTASPPTRLAASLQTLKGCARDSCRAAENKLSP